MQIIQQAAVTGCLSKMWYKEGTDLYLVKGNSRILSNINRLSYDTEKRVIGYGYEPFSEVLAYIVAKHLGISCVEYTLEKAEKFPMVKTYGLSYVSVCRKIRYPQNTAVMPAITFLHWYYDKPISEHWVLQKYLQMPASKEDLVRMFLFDAIIGNTDRHLNNWELLILQNGLVSNSLFDNGASLLATVPDSKLFSEFTIGPNKAKPFKATHTQQLALLKRYLPNVRIYYPNKDEIWQGIDKEIQPYLRLMPERRAACVYKYLRNRFYYFIDYFAEA